MEKRIYELTSEVDEYQSVVSDKWSGHDHNLCCHMRQACELEQNRNKDLCFVRYCFQPWP